MDNPETQAILSTKQKTRQIKQRMDNTETDNIKHKTQDEE